MMSMRVGWQAGGSAPMYRRSRPHALDDGTGCHPSVLVVDEVVPDVG